MNIKQSNTQEGLIVLKADGDLTGKEGSLVKLTAGGKVAAASAVTDLCPYVLESGGADGTDVEVRPLHPNRNVRLRAAGTGNSGALMILDSADYSKVEAYVSGAAQVVGIAEENFVDGQLVLVRPFPFAKSA